jgi:hypothetical protein
MVSGGISEHLIQAGMLFDTITDTSLTLVGVDTCFFSYFMMKPALSEFINQKAHQSRRFSYLLSFFTKLL